ncbi:MAG TPA: MFS transporter [Acetobacteraceae bacterium]|nr:MFS transporter [Acetobacteraceae bacterium]
MRLPAALIPLRNSTFRGLWLANVVAWLGTWLQNTGAGWLKQGLIECSTAGRSRVQSMGRFRKMGLIQTFLKMVSIVDLPRNTHDAGCYRFQRWYG